MDGHGGRAMVTHGLHRSVMAMLWSRLIMPWSSIVVHGHTWPSMLVPWPSHPWRDHGHAMVTLRRALDGHSRAMAIPW